MVCLGGFNTFTSSCLETTGYHNVGKLKAQKSVYTTTQIQFHKHLWHSSLPFFFSILYTSHINKYQARKVGCKSFSLPDRGLTPRLPSFLRRNVGRSLRPLKQEVLVKEGKINNSVGPFDVAPCDGFATVFFWGGRFKVISTQAKTLPQKWLLDGLLQ